MAVARQVLKEVREHGTAAAACGDLLAALAERRHGQEVSR
jgi:hypothetical protein